jgi:uncharacterized Ntn-hydrolase superfamily protein
MLYTTFSLTARCPRTGQFGVAVATRTPAVGAVVPHLRAGVGAIATQAWTNPYIGIDGLELLAQGASADQVLAAVRVWDPDVERRQFAIVDAHGGAAAHTGAETHDHAGHRTGDGFVAAGNLLAGPDVLDAMVAAFVAAPDQEVQDRLLAALAAGQAAGGDKRGKQSAALKVVDREDYPFIDLRVDEHADPIAELNRVYAVWGEALRPHLTGRPTRADLAARAGADRPRLLP